MELTRTETVAGLTAEYEDFAALLRDLSEEEWTRSTRCAGWEVRDVASHVVATTEDVVQGTVGQRTGDEQAKALRDVPADELADRLLAAAATIGVLGDSFDDDAWAAPSGVHDGTLGNGVRLLWYDTFVHADDIRAAVGRAPVGGPGLTASAVYLEEMLAAIEWGDATVDLRGIGTVSGGRGSAPLELDPRDFVLAATGRLDAVTLGLDERVNIYRD